MSYKENSFPLVKGNTNLTSGVYGQGTYLCVDDGALDVVWEDGTPETISTVAGDAFSFPRVQSVTVLSGTFHKA